MVEMSAMPIKMEKCKELVEYYLSLGLDVNAVDDQGRTPLHIVATPKLGKISPPPSSPLPN